MSCEGGEEHGAPKGPRVRTRAVFEFDEIVSPRSTVSSDALSQAQTTTKQQQRSGASAKTSIPPPPGDVSSPASTDVLSQAHTTTEKRKRSGQTVRPSPGDLVSSLPSSLASASPADGRPHASGLVCSPLDLVNVARGCGGGETLVSFDGACRGNGGKNEDRKGASAAAIFVLDPSGNVRGARYASRKWDAHTNNQTETYALCDALILVREFVAAQGEAVEFCTFKIRGDSHYVVQTMKEGRLASLTPLRSDQPNWEQWNAVRSTLVQLPACVVLDYEWIPRSLNVAADHVANAQLDVRHEGVYEFVLANPPRCSSATQLLDADVRRFWAAERRPSCKFLSPHLLQGWHKLVMSLLAIALNDPNSIDAWVALFMAPIVYLFPQSKMEQKSFLFLNVNPAVARSTCFATFAGGCSPRVPRPVTREPHLAEDIQRAVERGTRARAVDLLMGDNATVQPPTVAMAKKAFPETAADGHAFLCEEQFDIRFVEILEATRKLGARRASDILGWTKELMMPVLTLSTTSNEKRMIQDWMGRVANKKLPPVVLEMLNSDRGMFIGTAEKSRGVVVGSLFAKVLWRVAMQRADAFFPPQDILSVTTALQVEIADGTPVWHLDGKNAFFSLSRAAVFESLQPVAVPLLRVLWNTYYSTSSRVVFYDDTGAFAFAHPITTGVKAGCASASKLFNRTLEKAHEKFREGGVTALSIVDDFYVLQPPSMDDAALKVLARASFAYTKVDFFGEKTRKLTVDSAPTRILGAVVAPRPNLGLEEIFAKLQQPVLAAAGKLTTMILPIQTKYWLLRALELRLKHLYRATHLMQALKFATAADAVLAKCLLYVIDVHSLPTPSLPLIHLPVEEGGLGVGQLGALHALWWNKRVAALIAARRITGTIASLKRFGIVAQMIKGPSAETCEKDAIIEHHANGTPFIRALTSAMTKVRQAHLLNAEPTGTLKMQDRPFRALLWNRLQHLPPCIKIPCDLAGQSSFEHLQDCQKCRQGTVRHNAVLNELARCFRRAAMVVTVNPPDMPLPRPPDEIRNANVPLPSVAGPDLLVWNSPRECYDLTITNPSPVNDSGRSVARDCMRRAFSRKENVYEKWRETFGICMHPFVMTTTGFIHPYAVQQLERYAKQSQSSWFVAWTQLMLQKTLAAICADIYDAASARALGRSLFSQNVPPT